VNGPSTSGGWVSVSRMCLSTWSAHRMGTWEAAICWIMARLRRFASRSRRSSCSSASTKGSVSSPCCWQYTASAPSNLQRLAAVSLWITVTAMMPAIISVHMGWLTGLLALSCTKMLLFCLAWLHHPCYGNSTCLGRAMHKTVLAPYASYRLVEAGQGQSMVLTAALSARRDSFASARRSCTLLRLAATLIRKSYTLDVVASSAVAVSEAATWRLAAPRGRPLSRSATDFRVSRSVSCGQWYSNCNAIVIKCVSLLQ